MKYLVRIEWVENKHRVYKCTRFETNTLEEAEEKASVYKNKFKDVIVAIKIFKLVQV